MKFNNITNTRKMDKKQKPTDILQTPSLKENPFTVQEGYFSGIEDELHAKIHGRGSESHSTYSNLRTVMAMAAMFALIFGLGYSVLYITNTDNTKSRRDSINTTTGSATIAEDPISDTELLQYFGQHFGQYIGDEASYNQETLRNIKVAEHPVNKEEIEQYLIDSNVPSLVVIAALE
ncbi:MAG: hypothetical protein RSC28_02310 [Bacteroidales bacterium]